MYASSLSSSTENDERFGEFVHAVGGIVRSSQIVLMLQIGGHTSDSHKLFKKHPQ